MQLTKEQFNSILREYNQKQLDNERLLQNREEKLFQQIPRLRAITEAIASDGILATKQYIAGDKNARSRFHETLIQYKKEKADLLSQHGYSTDYLKPIYQCQDCKDTGYINGSYCHCFQQAAINLIYSQSHISDWFKEQNFKNFSFDYYSKTQFKGDTGMTSFDFAKKAFDKAQTFVNNFTQDGGNILLTGNTGTGKTFLTNCIASEIMNQGCTVIYLTATQLFDLFRQVIFEHNRTSDYDNLFTCDLLIIDDLGSEMSNRFTIPNLFQCINERLLNHKSTLISTNFSLEQISDTYTERIFSRFIENYDVITLFGDDIRLLKTFANN